VGSEASRPSATWQTRTLSNDGDIMKSTIAIFLVIPALTVGAYAVAQSPAAREDTTATSSSSAAVAADNTKSNKQDPSNRSQTADRQTNNATDLELTKRIRQGVLADKTLSTYAHNVKIVAVNGTVTLNGVVRSADEKARIGETSAAIAGAEHVVNDLKVASK
jgi:hyperosmotically inducible periplasmic protein